MAGPRRLGVVAGCAVVLVAAMLCAVAAVSVARETVAVTTSSQCSVLASGGSCSFGVSSTPDAPYSVAIPDGVGSLDVVMAAGSGANGDYGAIGGAGGLVVAQIPVPSSRQLLLYVGSNADSYNKVGAGWASGGEGVRIGLVGSGDSGAGGGASAVLDGGTAGTVLAVAGGGGGAGASYNNISVGGDGGAGGLPPGDGGLGGGVYNNPGAGGAGGAGGGASQPNGTNGQSSVTPAGGGGGGGGWRGGLGGGFATQFTASGGGGGGGQSYVNPDLPDAANAIYASSQSSSGGSITLSPGGQISTYPCNYQSDTTDVTLPQSTTSIFAVLAGASGSSSSDGQSTPGRGAVVTATLNLNGEQMIAVTPGCRYGPGWGLGGQRGDAGHAAGSDGGNGGGGSAIIDAQTGSAWLVAGGGGGAGGASLINNQKGGNGGDAGLAWWASGAGSGSPGQGDDSPDGGAGGANTAGGHPVNYGDSPAEVEFLGGGAGAGGGGGQGGQGGDTYNSYDGGGGGGAGSSVYDPSHAVNPTVAVSSAANADGYVVIIPLSTASNPGAEPPPSPAAGLFGSLKVTARVTGNDARAHRSARFSLMVACRARGRDIRLGAGQAPIFGLTASRSRKLEHLPLGAQCRVVQINSGGATKSTIEPSAAITITKAETTITVSNRFDVGTLAVRVRVPAHAVRLRKTARVYVLCAAIGAPQELRYQLPHAGYETVRIGTALMLRSVPAGADCSVVPLDRRLATTAHVSRAAVIRAGRRATLTITDHSLTPHFSLRVAAADTPADHGMSLTIQPDDQVTVSSGPNDGVRVVVKVAPSDGFVQIVNHTTETIVFRLGRSAAGMRRGRVRPHAVAWVNP